MSRSLCTSLTIVAVLLIVGAGRPAADDDRKSELRTSFSVDKSDLGPSGKNPYIVLQPGYRLRYKGSDSTLTSTVLDDTKKIDGVETRIIEEREVADGQLVERIRNYIAVNKKTGDLYFFGQDVTSYEDGEVSGHDGSWQAGVEDAKFGLLMPGEPKVGDRFQQEDAPGIAEDRCEIVAIGDDVSTPAGDFGKCLRTNDTTALAPGASKRVYAPGVGLVLDDEFALAKIEKPAGGDNEDKAESKKDKDSEKSDADKKDADKKKSEKRNSDRKDSDSDKIDDNK